MDLTFSFEKGSEEAKTLNVVGVQMRQQNVDSFGFLQGRAQPSDARPSVQNQGIAIEGPYLNARRVSAVLHGFRPRAGQRTPGSPKTDPRG